MIIELIRKKIFRKIESFTAADERRNNNEDINNEPYHTDNFTIT